MKRKVIFILVIVILLIGAIVIWLNSSSDLSKYARTVGLKKNDDYMIGVALLDNKDEHINYIGTNEKLEYYELEGQDIYLVIPKYKDSTINVYEARLDDNGNLVKNSLLFTTYNPFVIKCNVSDIIPSIILEVSYNDKVIEYSPSLSLKDGSLFVTDDVLNITKD